MPGNIFNGQKSPDSLEVRLKAMLKKLKTLKRKEKAQGKVSTKKHLRNRNQGHKKGSSERKLKTTRRVKKLKKKTGSKKAKREKSINKNKRK